VLSLIFFPVLHPQYKLEYFKDAKWEPEWITIAEELVCTQFELSYYKFSQEEIKITKGDAGKTASGKSVGFLFFILMDS